jgi:hypothetical protein
MRESERKNGVFANIKKLFSYRSGNGFPLPILPNAEQPLQTPTYDGSGQVVHPCVIDFFNEYGIDSWSGYRYWMVLTPYPNGQNQYENPSLYASHDGLSWIVPPDITNPLDTASGGLDKGFLFDPDMIFNPDSNQLWIYYRFANSAALRMHLIKINHDLTMTKPVTIMEQSPWIQQDNRHRSFCIWRESSDRWHMWGGGGEAKSPYNTYYFFSTDGLCWGEPQRVVNEDGLDPFQALGLSNWHMAGKPNKKERRVEFLVYSLVDRTIQRHLFASKNPNPVVYAECPMDAPTLFRTPLSSPVLLPSKSGWDNGHLYRCSFQIIDDGTGYLYSIWYSARGSDGQWHLGHTEGVIESFYREKNSDVSH